MKCAITAVKKYYSMLPVNRNLYSISSSRLSTPFVRAYTTVNTPSKISSALSDHASTFSFDSAEWTPRFDWRQRRASSKHKQDPVSSKRNKKGFTRRVNPPHMPVEIYQPFYEQIEQYTKHFMPLLEAEQAEDEAQIKQRLASWSLDRLKQEGYCITGLSAFWLQYAQMGRPVATFSLGPGEQLPQHNFENGTQVLVTRIDPLKEVPIRGSVLAHTETQLKVSFQEPFDLESGPWRLDLGRSNIIHQRMCTAISHLNHDPDILERDSSSADRQFILQGTHLRDILLRSFTSSSGHSHSAPLQPADDASYVSHETLEHEGKLGGDTGGAFKDDILIQSWARRYMRPNPVKVEGDPELQGLNPTQIRAVATMIGERLSLIQGPPGTGKTKTIIETVNLLKNHFEVIHPILVCTYTNVAVDNLVEGFARSGLRPLRIGYGKVRPSLLEHTLDDQLSKHELKPKLDKASADLERVEKQLKPLSDSIDRIETAGNVKHSPRLENMKRNRQRLENRSAKLKAQEYAIYQTMLADVISQADVICTTCISSASASLNVTDFPVVFLDEASMSTEPGSLIPIMKGCRHLALIGDHKQLPPVITSREAQAKGLGISLFERLAEEGEVPSVMLDIQYRMHPDISKFPSAEFYNFSLQDGTVDGLGNVSSLLIPPNSSHLVPNRVTGNRPSVIFLSHAGSESSKDRSRVNWNEAFIVCSVVEDLLLHNPDLCASDIGIIAPYVAQISLLTRLLNTTPANQRRFEQVLGEERTRQLANIEIKTVDGFEGREKEIIIFSTVRNNSYGNIGFLADRRRLNVGLTRAKRGLFVVGSIETLKSARFGGGEHGKAIKSGKGAEAWKRYAEFLDKNGLIIQLSGDKLKDTLYGNYNNARGAVVEH